MNKVPLRLDWLDTCKGLGIVLVVAGHVLLRSDWPVAQSITQFIYLFHMPLFFVLAGITLRPEPLGPFAIRKALALLIPYLFFLALLGAPALASTCWFGTQIPALGIDRCAIMAAKLLLGGSSLGGIFGAFWFIPCLLFALLLAQFLLKCSANSLQWTLALTTLLIVAYALPHLPGSTALLSLGVVPMATLLVLIGYAASRWSRPISSPALLASGALAALAISFGQSIDMKAGNYGQPVLTIAAAVALTLLAIKLCQIVTVWPPVFSPLQALGRRTLTILYLHQAIHLTLRELGLNQDVPLIMASLLAPALLHTLLTRTTTRISLHLSPKSSPA
jgi:fucose 4-O-acetylase-like acetyltransferase